MKSLFILLLIILSCSGSNEKKTKLQNDNNIFIKSPEFKTIIKNFYKDAIYYSPYAKNDTISVSIWKNESDINVSFNSFTKLKSEYYIGKTDLDSLKILFYTNDLESTKDFIELEFIDKDTIQKKIYNKKTGPPVYKETYEKFYTYKDGKLTLMKWK